MERVFPLLKENCSSLWMLREKGLMVVSGALFVVSPSRTDVSVHKTYVWHASLLTSIQGNTLTRQAFTMHLKDNKNMAVM